MPVRLPRLLVAILVLSPALFLRADAPPKTSVARMRADLTFLASDACEGRGPGTAGIDKAADHVAATFKTAGLNGAMPDGSFFQPFTVRGNPTLAPGARVNLAGPGGEPTDLKLDEQFQAIGLS
ncbi:MAG TPA: hypothetical protein VH120_03045, partial [Gemmataceae bacterium]|nr:hypothetical protein [Gemmataceae bacterium]